MKIAAALLSILSVSRVYMSDPTDVAQAPNAPLATGAVGATDTQKEALHSRLASALETAGAYVHGKVNALLNDIERMFTDGEDDADASAEKLDVSQVQTIPEAQPLSAVAEQGRAGWAGSDKERALSGLVENKPLENGTGEKETPVT